MRGARQRVVSDESKDGQGSLDIFVGQSFYAAKEIL